MNKLFEAIRKRLLEYEFEGYGRVEETADAIVCHVEQDKYDKIKFVYGFPGILAAIYLEENPFGQYSMYDYKFLRKILKKMFYKVIRHNKPVTYVLDSIEFGQEEISIEASGCNVILKKCSISSSYNFSVLGNGDCELIVEDAKQVFREECYSDMIKNKTRQIHYKFPRITLRNVSDVVECSIYPELLLEAQYVVLDNVESTSGDVEVEIKHRDNQLDYEKGVEINGTRIMASSIKIEGYSTVKIDGSEILVKELCVDCGDINASNSDINAIDGAIINSQSGNLQDVVSSSLIFVNGQEYDSEESKRLVELSRLQEAKRSLVGVLREVLNQCGSVVEGKAVQESKQSVERVLKLGENPNK